METKKYFYYGRDNENKPIVTVCLQVEKLDGKIMNISRGVAICSKKDIPKKKIGRIIASARANNADKYKDGRPVFEILTNKHNWVLSPNTIFSWKGEANPFLTDYEKRIIGVGK